MSNETFALEKTLSEYLDKYLYVPSGYQITKMTTKEDQEVYGDKKLIIGERTTYIDEKAAGYLHKDMVNELIQDVGTLNIGWFFHLSKCQYLVYGYFDGANPIPHIIYRVDWPKNKSHIIKLMADNSRELRYGTTSKNFGLTLNVYYPWEKLLEIGIAKVVEIKAGKCTICGSDKSVIDGLCDTCRCATEGWEHPAGNVRNA